jgi:hypothetical protein
MAVAGEASASIAVVVSMGKKEGKRGRGDVRKKEKRTATREGP